MRYWLHELYRELYILDASLIQGISNDQKLKSTLSYIVDHFKVKHYVRTSSVFYNISPCYFYQIIYYKSYSGVTS